MTLAVPQLLNLEASTTSIVDLNDDCLYEIFGYLKFVDKLHLSLLCPRLADAFRSYFKMHPIKLNKDDIKHAPLSELQEFLKLFGESVKWLIMLPYQERNEFVTLVNKHCPNMRNINIFMLRLETYNLRNLLINMDHLIELSCIACELDDEAVQIISTMSNLEILRLGRNSYISGIHLWNLNKLWELHIPDCGILDENLEKICKSLPQLKILDLSNCQQLTPFGYDSLKYGEKLEVLKITCSSDISLDCLWHLKRLRVFCYDFHCLPDLDFISPILSLAALETLSIAHCFLLTNNDLLLLLDKCLKLKKVNIMECSSITEEFVYNAIDLLETQDSNGQRDFTCGPITFLDSRQFPKSVLKNPKYLAAARLIEIRYSNILMYNFLHYMRPVFPHKRDLEILSELNECAPYIF